MVRINDGSPSFSTLRRRRAMIFESVWGLRFDPGTNLIDVHIARLRRKVENDGEPSLIRTMRGSGYRFG